MRDRHPMRHVPRDRARAGAQLRVWPALIALLLFGPMGTMTARGQAEAGSASAEEAATEEAPLEIGQLFPVGRIFQGVRIPSYTSDTLTSLVTAETMERIDEEHIEMFDLVIRMYGAPHEGDTVIVTDRAIYDLNSRKLTSRTRAFITRGEQFDKEGDRLIFDMVTSTGRLVGNVRMFIYETTRSPAPKAGEASDPDAAGAAPGDAAEAEGEGDAPPPDTRVPAPDPS